jgi:chemotaxis protein CheX
MNVDVINAFLNSSIHVLKVMASLDATAGKPFLKKDRLATGDVSGIITFSGPLVGSFALSFSSDCILKVASTMLREEISSINHLARDTAGELTNMISGDARKRLESKGLIIRAGIPSIVSGKDHEIGHVLAGPSIAIPFTTAFGPFVADVNIQQK